MGREKLDKLAAQVKKQASQIDLIVGALQGLTMIASSSEMNDDQHESLIRVVELVDNLHHQMVSS